MQFLLTRLALAAYLVFQVVAPVSRSIDASEKLEIHVVLDAGDYFNPPSVQAYRDELVRLFQSEGHGVSVTIHPVNLTSVGDDWTEWLARNNAVNSSDALVLQPGFRLRNQDYDTEDSQWIEEKVAAWKSLVVASKQVGIRSVLVTPAPVRFRDSTLNSVAGDIDQLSATARSENQIAYARAFRTLSFDEQLPLADVDQSFLAYDLVEGQSIFTLLPNGMDPGMSGQKFMAEIVATTLMQAFHWRAMDYSTIPQIDLDDQHFRQVVVDREEGQYLGHPTTVLLEDGKTLLAVYPKGHGAGGIVYKRSSNGGLDWSERLPVPENWSGSAEVPTIYPTIDSTGKKRLILFSGLYPIRMAYSENDGESWTPLEPIGEFGGIVAMASLARAKNGRYTAFFHDDGRFIDGSGFQSDRFYVYQTHSDDGGMSWSAPTVIASHPTALLCEPGLVVSPDGTEWALLLRENSRRHNSFVIFSRDEGETWSEPVELPASLTGDRHTARYAPDGRLFISFRDTGHNSPTQGDWVAWVGHYEDIQKGRQGLFRVRLKENKHAWDTAYPGVEVLPDGTIVTTTYGHWDENEEPYILSVRLKMEEMDAIVGY